MGDTIIEIQSLSKSFGSVQALNNIDLEIAPGVFGLIGPNGAGKTTLFRIFLNLIRPDSGAVRVFGLDVTKKSLAVRRQIGVLHERPAYPAFLTPLEYLSRMSRLYDKQRNPEELLQTVDLLRAKDRRIGDLSAGMYQRLGLAQSLMGSPKLVFLDEPTSNLDVTGRAQILELIMRLHKDSGTSFVISSHILSELQTVCDSVAFLVAGTIKERGTMLEIIKKYASNMVRIVVSDAAQLAALLTQEPWAERIRVAGPNALTISSSLEPDIVKARVKDAISGHSIEVFDVSRASNLEDIFREVVMDA
jgi:ABC-2 type transport system ATP-binding protein